MIAIRRISPEKYSVSNQNIPNHIFQRILKDLRNAMFIDNPNYNHQVRFYLKNKRPIPEYISKQIFLISNSGTFGVGYLSLVLKQLKILGVKTISVIEKPIIVDFLKYKIDDSFFERDYQLQALKAFQRNDCYGIVENPTGSGKSFLAIATAKFVLDNDRKNKVLIFVSSRTAIDRDFSNELNKFLYNQNLKYQILDSDLKFEADTDIFLLTIQSFQSAHRKFKKRKAKTSKENFVEFRRNFTTFVSMIKLLIVDECLEYGTILRKRLLALFVNAYMRLFVSATPFKKHSEISKMNIIETQKKIVYTIKEKDLVEQGFLSKNKSFFVNIGNSKLKRESNFLDFKASSGSDFNEFMNEYLIKNEERLDALKFILEICEAKKLITLVLIDRIELGNFLADKLFLQFVKGEDSSDQRNLAIKKMLKGEPLIASKIFRQGLNVPELQVLINYSGGKDQEVVIQKKGRVVRKSANNRKCYIDFIDWGNIYLEDHSFERISAIERTLGKDDIVICDRHDIGNSLIRFFKN